MSIRSFVSDWAERALANPAFGSDPGAIRALKKEAADTYDDSFYALNAPAAPLRWEVKTVLLSSQLVSERKPFNCPYSIEIIAFRPVLVVLNTQSATAGVVVPTLDDIDVAIDLDQNRFYTNAQGNNFQGGPVDGTFITLGSCGIQAPALWRMQPEGASPVLGFTFRWKQPVNVYKDSQICVTIFAKKAPALPAKG